MTGSNRKGWAVQLLQEIDHPCNSASETSCFLSNGLLFETTPPNFVLLLHNVPLLCVLDLPMVLL